MERFRIVEERKNYYVVDIPGTGQVKAVLKGVIRKNHKRLAVGDFVTIDLFDAEKSEAIIRSVEKRTNELPRPLVANIDQVIFINCFAEPELEFSYIDRFLFAASVNEIPVKMIFNKIDLLSEEDREDLEAIADEYREIGYEVTCTSMNLPETVEDIREICRDKLTVFAGPSGVGKSSLMSKLFPHREFITNELSESISRGKNTTTHTTLLTFDDGSGYVADTPGFSMMKMPKIDPAQVMYHFHEIGEAAKECRFGNCMHEHEPGCAVKELVEAYEISDDRYANYLALLELMRDGARDYKNKDLKYL